MQSQTPRKKRSHQKTKLIHVTMSLTGRPDHARKDCADGSCRPRPLGKTLLTSSGLPDQTRILNVIIWQQPSQISARLSVETLFDKEGEDQQDMATGMQ